MTIHYRIPTEWKDILLKDYQKFYTAIHPYESTEDFGKKVVEKSALFLCGLKQEYLYQLPQTEIHEITDWTNKLLIASQETTLVQRFELDGIEYGFEPDLNKISYGAYLDLVSYAKNTWDNMAIILAILYRPIISSDKWSRYTIEEYKGTDDDIVKLFQDKITMDIVFGATSFFFHLSKELLKTFLHYLQDQTKIELNNIHLKEVLQQNGLNTPQLSDLLEMILQESITQLK